MSQLPEITDLAGVAKVADSKLANKVYDEGVSPAMRESGLILRDAAKSLRLFLAPLQLLAAWQDRLEAFLERVRNKVPEDRQQDAAPSIALPVMMALRYMEDESILTEMFLNLLARAIDTDRSREAHPGFVKIIEQLSPDEALFIVKFKDMPAFAGKTEDVKWLESHVTMASLGVYHTIMDEEYVRTTAKGLILQHIDHLLALGILHWRQSSSTPSLGPSMSQAVLPTGVSQQYHAVLSPFGKAFIDACIPDDFDIVQRRKHRQE